MTCNFESGWQEGGGKGRAEQGYEKCDILQFSN